MLNKSRSILKWNDWLIFALLSLIWGSSFILIKKSLVVFDPVTVASLRILFATIAFLPVLATKLYKINFNIWYKYLIVGLAGTGIPAFLFAIAQTRVSSNLAGALNTLTPIFTLIIAVLLFRTRFDLKKVSGVFLGLIGAASIIYTVNSDFKGGVFFTSLIVIASILYGLNVNLVKKYFDNHDTLILTAASFIFFGPVSIIILAKTDFLHQMQNNDKAWVALLSVATLSLFSTVISTVLFFRLVQKSNAVFASSVSFTAPVVALLWGWLDGESFNVVNLISLTLILLGVYLTRNGRRK